MNVFGFAILLFLFATGSTQDAASGRFIYDRCRLMYCGTGRCINGRCVDRWFTTPRPWTMWTRPYTSWTPPWSFTEPPYTIRPDWGNMPQWRGK
uniref:Defensin n=1 Tax=Plectus sambesii TaxID=2011161 RepID=A0A914X613_9BILA